MHEWIFGSNKVFFVQKKSEKEEFLKDFSFLQSIATIKNQKELKFLIVTIDVLFKLWNIGSNFLKSRSVIPNWGAANYWIC